MPGGIWVSPMATATADPTTGTATPPPSTPLAVQANSATGGAVWIGFAAVLLAAAIVAAWNILLARRRSREEERARQRDAFAQAFKAYGRYKEMPYAIRRRSADEPAVERVRLSETVREIQADLTYHQTWMDLESRDVSSAYRDLVKALRVLAGGHMRDAWKTAPIATDAEMNMIIDLSQLEPLEQVYLAAVNKHLTCLAPWWCR